MLDKTCVHTFQQGGLNLVIDGNSGAVHAVDDEALALIARCVLLKVFRILKT